jgi:GxxExxY protein
MTRMDAENLKQPRVRECYETLFEEALTGKIIGAFYHVHFALGYGFLESVYKKALHRELLKRGLRCEREVVVDVYYEGEVVGVFRPDIIVESRVVLEVKASRKLDPTDASQLFNYLRATDLELGLLLHFGPRASVKRLIETKSLRHRTPKPRSSAHSVSSVAALSTNNAVALPPLRP